MMGGDQIEPNLPEPGSSNPAAGPKAHKSQSLVHNNANHLHGIVINRKTKECVGSVCNQNIAPVEQQQSAVQSPSISTLKLNGGASSAWRASAYSRGPVNYPNNGWYDGKQQFNQFTKTGEYIKNTDLPYAAAPISTGAIKDPDCMKGTISKWGDQFAKFGGAKKKKSPPKKKKSVPKKKKSVPKKKKSVPKKKKRSKK
jgi:hypothetical protein